MSFIIQGKTNIKYLLIVVSVAALAIGGIFWCLSKERNIEDFLFVQLPEKGNGETIDWESCVSEDFGYSVRYPPVFFNYSDELGHDCMVFYLKEASATQYLRVFAQRKPENFSILNWLNSAEYPDWLLRRNGPILNTDYEEKMMSGAKWLVFKEDKAPFGVPPDIEIRWIIQNQKENRVLLLGLSGLNYNEYKPIVELMFSTLRFLD